MNVINFILSVYLIVLSCLPCADLKVNTTANISTEVLANHDKHAHDNEIDLCSPFCSCNCCGQQILNFNQEITFVFNKIFLKISTQIPTYKPIFTSNFYGSIWQPPQIA